MLEREAKGSELPGPQKYEGFGHTRGIAQVEKYVQMDFQTLVQSPNGSHTMPTEAPVILQIQEAARLSDTSNTTSEAFQNSLRICLAEVNNM
jgi:hypothetical protein